MVVSHRLVFWSIVGIIAVVPSATTWGQVGNSGSNSKPRATAGASASDVLDDGGMFSKEAIRQAKETLGRIDRSYHVAVTVETVESLRGQELEEVAIRRAEQLNHQGIFVLIARQDRKAEALASPKELRDELGRPRLHAIRDAFIAEFKRGDVDAGLRQGLAAAERILAEIRPDAARDAALVEGGSSTTNSPLVVRGQVRLTLLGARKILQGAEAKAVELKLKANLTVVDDAGLLVAFERMDGSRPASISTSQTKAVSAATFRVATGPSPASASQKANDPFLNYYLEAAAANSGGKITSLPGGVPIVVDGQVIGAIGVAGGSSEQDVEVAQAGVAAFVLGLNQMDQNSAGTPGPNSRPITNPPEGNESRTSPFGEISPR